MKLSVIMPVFNEKNTIEEIIKRVEAVDIDKEIIIVDDNSCDGTREILKKLDSKHKVVCQPKNLGKGAAIIEGLKYVTGDIVIIQDADLEYNPRDYYILIKPIVDGKSDVVFGSRVKGKPTGTHFFNVLGNRFLTFLFNVLNKSCISDMETCYKVMRTDIMKGLNLKSRTFDIEPEIASKVVRKGHAIYEVPISYSGRKYREGKKMNWIEGFKAIYVLFEYRFFD